MLLCRKHPVTPGEASLTPMTPQSLVQGRAHLTPPHLPLVSSLTPSPRAELLSSVIGTRTWRCLKSRRASPPASPCPARPPPLPLQAPGSQSLLAARPCPGLWQQLPGRGWWSELCLRPFWGPESVKSPPTPTRRSCLPCNGPSPGHPAWSPASCWHPCPFLSAAHLHSSGGRSWGDGMEVRPSPQGTPN